MKDIKKILGALAATVVAFTLTSCGNDNPEYTPASAETTAQVYFSSDASSTIELSLSETSFEIPIYRAVTSGSVTVPLTVTASEDLYDIPSSVTFADGESETSLVITYDPDELEYDNYTDITIEIDEDYATLYGLSSYSFSVGVPAPWESLGNCTYTDDFITTFYGVDNLEYEVEIQENSQTPGYFRLVNPYGEAYGYNETYDDGTADWDTSQDWYFEIHAEDPDGVYIELQETGMDWGYGNIIMGSLAAYYMASGYTLDEMKEYGYTGTYADGVITFPTSTLLICMPDYSSSYYYANTNGAFKVVMPGVVTADYSVEVAYSGQYTNDDDEPAGVIANITSLGADVEYVRLTVVEGTSVSDTDIEALTAGTVAYTEVSAAGTCMVEWNDTPVDGRYTILAVSYADDEAQESATATFKYAATTSAETWTAIYTGDYEYVYFWVGIDEGLTLYQSDEDSSRFKIENWGYGVDFIFTYDSSTGTVLVEDQETGYEHSSYGMVYVMDLVEYTGSTGYGESYYDSSTGTFYFNVIYYVSAGYFGYGYESFTLTGYAAKAITGSKSGSSKTVDENARVKFNKSFSLPNPMGKMFK